MACKTHDQAVCLFVQNNLLLNIHTYPFVHTDVVCITLSRFIFQVLFTTSTRDSTKRDPFAIVQPLVRKGICSDRG